MLLLNSIWESNYLKINFPFLTYTANNDLNYENIIFTRLIAICITGIQEMMS